jgi:hypothetical protein
LLASLEFFPGLPRQSANFFSTHLNYYRPSFTFCELPICPVHEISLIKPAILLKKHDD